MENKVSKQDLTQEQWDKAVRRLAYDFLTIRICPHCNYPLVSGYVCSFCGKDPSRDIDPEQ